MRFIIAIFFAFFATAFAFPDLHILDSRKNKNGTSKGNSANKACRQMAKLTQLTELAANQTKLDALVTKGKLTTDDVTTLKAKAANSTATLQTLQSNTTLVDECNAINANKKVKAQCAGMKQLAKLAAMATNQTALDAFVAKKKLNDTQVTDLKDKIAKSQTKLQEMQSNSTLTALCAQQKSAKSGDNNANGQSTTQE